MIRRRRWKRINDLQLGVPLSFGGDLSRMRNHLLSATLYLFFELRHLPRGTIEEQNNEGIPGFRKTYEVIEYLS